MADGPEKKIENKIKEELKDAGAYYIKNFASELSGKGHPDITAVYGGKLRGKLLAIEVKKPIGGKPTPIQVQRLALIAKNGGRAVITAEPHTFQYLIGTLDTSVSKIRIKDLPKNLQDYPKIWTHRPKNCNIVEIIK